MSSKCLINICLSSNKKALYNCTPLGVFLALGTHGHVCFIPPFSLHGHGGEEAVHLKALQLRTLCVSLGTQMETHSVS